MACALLCGCVAHRQGTVETNPAKSGAPPATPAGTPANPNQAANDAEVQRILGTIAGREKLPAEQVFQNLQVAGLKTMPAERLLRIMNMGYSRALGVACTHCHVEGDFASDDKRPKRAARDMVALARAVNEQIGQMKYLDPERTDHVINCGTCHRGGIDPRAGDR